MSNCVENVHFYFPLFEHLNIEIYKLYQKDLKSRIIHLKSLLDRYDLNYTGITVELPINKPYDCNTRNAKKAWIYSDVLERQNRKLEKYLMDLNKHLSDYGMNHPEIMSDPGII